VQGATSAMSITKALHITEDEALRARHKVGYRLFKHGINLKVTLEATWRTGLIPPFLHGEPLPEQVCVYDAEEVGFRRTWAAAYEAEQRACDTEYAETAAWLRGRDTPDDEDYVDGQPSPPVPDKSTESTELPETDQLTDSDIYCWRSNVARSLRELWARMRKADPDEQQRFPVEIDSDEDDMWDDMLDEDDEDLAEWMDAAEGDIEYVLAEELIGGMGEEDEMFWETQAQALLAAAQAAAEDVLTEHEVDDDLD
jgi:hypothetical protein